MDLAKVHWPVFKLLDEKPAVIGTRVLYSRLRLDMETSEYATTEKVIDDTSLPGTTLGARRLVLASQGVKLLKIKKAVYFLSDLTKLAKANSWFIDSSGYVFQYKKSARCKLVCKKITNIHPGKTTGVILELEGIHSRFKAMRSPEPYEMYAGVLLHKSGYLLYGIYEHKFKDSWRMI